MEDGRELSGSRASGPQDPGKGREPFPKAEGGQGRAPRVSCMKILGACKKGQMIFHFLEGCSLLIYSGPCVQGTRVGIIETVCIYVWWAKV